MYWIKENAQVLSLFISVLMLIVWLSYLHLFWRSFRRQLLANVVISRGAGSTLDALCLISNMSGDAVLIEGIVVFVEAGGTRWSCAVNEQSELAHPDRGRSPREGPLKPGDYFDIGSFRDLARLAVGRSSEGSKSGADRPESIEIWVVADYRSDSDLVLSTRRFLFKERGGKTIASPEGHETKRVTSRAERMHVLDVMRRHLEGTEEVPGP